MDGPHHSYSSPLIINAAPPSFSWYSCFWEESFQQKEAMEVDSLKQALLRTTLELESTRLIAQEEMKKLESQSLHLSHLLQLATRERDEARRHCHSLLQLLSKIPHPNPNPSPDLEESGNRISSSSSDEEEEVDESSREIISMSAFEAAVKERKLPEKGRLVEAVMKAGPLLQTLLLAGPLPQWRHPPPAVRSFEIPPVSIGASPSFERKRKRDEEEKKAANCSSTPYNSGYLPERNGSSKSKSLFRQQQLISSSFPA